ncbi:hypothetical protein ACEZDB_36385 [Streptacidiphilus sp. N1-3]|uniref:DksA C4-type domain-containing protein n=1 Tax=Streptacidiphilus alkalitolerans TaxID=3342712 RepID=A0ABV6XD48_9ACTN
MQKRDCGYCPEQTAGPLRGERGGRRAAQDHPGCYGRLLADLSAVESATRTAREASRLAALQTGIPHSEDRALLDAQEWDQPAGHRYCDECHCDRPTLAVGAGLRWCRVCAGRRLTATRALAEEHPRRHTPALPTLRAY